MPCSSLSRRLMAMLALTLRLPDSSQSISCLAALLLLPSLQRLTRVVLLLLTYPAAPWQYQPRLGQLLQQRAAALAQLQLVLMLMLMLSLPAKMPRKRPRKR
jgi:hypothetical protein